jgi:DnaJ domain
MTNYFKDCSTVAEIKNAYRKLARKHHPDLGGSTEEMQRINAAYDAALKGCNGQKTTGDDGKEHTYTYNPDVEGKIKEAIYALLALEMDAVDIWLIGTWIWIEGETKPYKESLKALGCRWHSKRGCWYIAGQTSTGYRRRSSKGIDDIANDYGAAKFVKNQNKKLA